MFRFIIKASEQFEDVLIQLPKDCYIKPCASLSEPRIGQHSNHIINLYQCLLQVCKSREDYYNRSAINDKFENELFYTIQVQNIQNELDKPVRYLKVIYDLEWEEVTFSSNYFREVIYNLERALHYEALIKLSICQFTDIFSPISFGVAPSTIESKNNGRVKYLGNKKEWHHQGIISQGHLKIVRSRGQVNYIN